MRRRQGFDLAWYGVLLGRKMSLPSAVDHYLGQGRSSGWFPHPLFDADYFLAHGGATLPRTEAFAGYVLGAGRRDATHPLFDVDGYLRWAPDAESFPGGPITHYQEIGSAAGLPPNGWFEPAAHGRSVVDLLMAHATDWAARYRLARPRRLTGRFDRAAAQRFVDSFDGVVPERGDAEVTVSVVVPVWNRAEMVGRSIDSVLAQTLSDWELIVVDDGSTDDLDAVVERYADEPRIRFLRCEHGGAAAARNAGTAVARGRYLAWLDSDDTWTPEHLRVLISFMQRDGHRAAYDVLELRRPDGPTGYRTLAGGRAHLVTGNHIGQPVLIHERSLVDEIGGFDERLPRTVDFDFVLRLSAVTDPGFAPFVGCVVNHDPGDTSRITRSLPAAWMDVVLNRNTLDWPQAAGAVTSPDRATVVVVPAAEDDAADCVEHLLAAVDAEPVDVVVVDNGLRLGPSQLVAALAWRFPQVRVVPAPSDRGWAIAHNLGVVVARSQVVVLLDAAARPRPGWLRPMRVALDDPTVCGVQSVAVDGAGRVLSAGAELGGPDGLPRSHAGAAETESSAQDSQAVDVLTWGACAFRHADLVGLEGLDPLMRPELATADLCLRVARRRPGSFLVLTSSVVTLPPDRVSPHGRHVELDAAAADEEGRELFRERWPAPSENARAAG